MPQLLLEFFSEEIPARMQKRAEEDLARLVGEGLSAGGLANAKMRTLSGPRRIALIVDDLPAATPDVNEERKGPKVGAPAPALAGFVRAAGLAQIEDAQIQKDPKGDFYVARMSKKGRATAALIAEIAPKVAREFPWPKSMRSGSSDFIWVRPLHKVLCVFDGKPVKFEIAGVTSGDETEGHRFHAPAWIKVKNAADYEAKLKAAYVLVDREARKAKILADAKAACAALQLELVEDAGLLEEVAGLAEWPVVVVGDMDAGFLDLPPEVIRLTMRTHQRYFAVRGRDRKLAPHFIAVANVEARDGGAAIAAGNARVLSARLNDARFFWDNDKRAPLEARVEKLKQIVFHQKLGSVWDKVERVRALAKELAPIVKADPALVDRAALLAKADLVTETVGEFPELQGQIGRDLAALQGEKPSVAVAIEDHYRPVGPNDRVPSDPVALAVALADKLDTLVGFWAIDEKPTGSRDPYALRRAALGTVRLVLENGVRLRIAQLLEEPIATAWGQVVTDKTFEAYDPAIRSLHDHDRDADADTIAHAVAENIPNFSDPESVAERELIAYTLLSFFADRLKVQLRDQGKRHDLVDAVFALGDDDLVRIVARVDALEAFLKTEDGANLLTGYRRAANILKAEEKKDANLAARLAKGLAALNREKLTLPAERDLLNAVNEAGPAARKAVGAERFEEAMAALAKLRAPVDRFFDEVLVNDKDDTLRLNRLLLLAQIREALHGVADFSRIEG
jgi:glycyl-tRNA synthetase beta chain